MEPQADGKGTAIDHTQPSLLTTEPTAAPIQTSGGDLNTNQDENASLFDKQLIDTA